MTVKLNLIAAVCENMGIGKNNNLPWKLRMTSTTNDSSKKNVVIMGRKTWDSIPKKNKPLPGRINFILSRSDLDLNIYSDVYGFKSFELCLKKLEDETFMTLYESVWVMGGSHIYQEAIKSDNFYRLYLTKILKSFDCDKFFPALPSNLEKVSDPDVPEEKQTEKGIDFTYNVYQNPTYGTDT